MPGKLNQKTIATWLIAAVFVAALANALLQRGSEHAPSSRQDDPDAFRIVSGSENETLEPIVLEFCRQQRRKCIMEYAGSLDIKLALEEQAPDFDAVWPAHSRWVEMGDRQRRVKHLKSITQTPVVFAVRLSKARALGLIDRPVTMDRIVELVQSGQLSYLMTSATQSNSGFSMYSAMMTSLAGTQDALTMDDLENPRMRQRVNRLLDGIQRSSGSSGWLKELFLEGAQTDSYMAMVNYEAVIIETNQELERRRLEPLYALYPVDGVALSDSPLGFFPRRSDPDYEAFFLELQAHLLSTEVQEEMQRLGRRSAFGGLVSRNARSVFRADWGMDPERVLTSIRFPPADVIEQALMLYQEVLRKPSLTVMCLDYSGSMSGSGERQLESALTQLFEPTQARRLMLQPTASDITVAIPFNHAPGTPIRATGPNELETLLTRIRQNRADGGTNMYECARMAMENLLKMPEIASHNSAIVLLTDGRSDGDQARFARWYRAQNADIPIYGITFGDADETQMKAMAALTRARVFHGRSDLMQAFRKVRGYN